MYSLKKIKDKNPYITYTFTRFITVKNLRSNTYRRKPVIYIFICTFKMSQNQAPENN